MHTVREQTNDMTGMEPGATKLQPRHMGKLERKKKKKKNVFFVLMYFLNSLLSKKKKKKILANCCGIRGVKHFGIFCYWKTINSGCMTSPAIDFCPITAPSEAFYFSLPVENKRPPCNPSYCSTHWRYAGDFQRRCPRFSQSMCGLPMQR